MRAVYKLSLLSALTVMGAAACADILGFERFTDLERVDAAQPPTDAAQEAAVIPPLPECLSLGLPPIPTDGGTSDADAIDSEAGTSGPEDIVVAISKFDVGLKDSLGTQQAIGLNLDLTCTTSRETSSCKLPRGTDTEFQLYQTDKSGGVDNAGFALISKLGNFYGGISAETFNEDLKRGRFGLVFVISGYNGQPNDNEVFVRAFPALGIEPKGGADGGTPDATPTFDKTDRWVFDREYASLPGNDDSSKISAQKAYVTGGKLVAVFTEFAVGLPFPNNDRLLTIALNEAFLVGTLAKQENSSEYVIRDGFITGRWPVQGALKNINELQVNLPLDSGSLPVCKLGSIADEVRKSICGAVDLSSSSAQKDPASPCVSVSVAVGFEARPAGFGVGRQGASLGNECPETSLCSTE